MRLLDLFCGGGGAAMGYIQAGFAVVGVDHKPQPGYPGKFEQSDALDYLKRHGHEFDLVHASPPCQGYSKSVTHVDSKWVSYSRGKNEPRLIDAVRELMQGPYVIENVEGARDFLRDPVILCGSMFDAYPRRHRLFETNWGMAQPPHPSCKGRDKAYSEANGIDYRDMSVTGKSRRTGSIDVWKKLMGMDWPGLRGSDLAEAIPPRYSRYVGQQFMAQELARAA